MSQLDDRLEAALQARADCVQGLVLSPPNVRAAARWQQHRARVSTALALALLLLPAAGFALGQRQQPTRTATRPVTPPPSGAAAALPWSGSTDLVLRNAGTGRTPGGWQLCFGEACADIAAPGPHSVSLIHQPTTVQGLAPIGTTRVTVATHDAGAVEAQLATPSGPHPAGVLFGAPEVTISRPEGSAFSLTYQVTAYDAAGAQLAARTAVGGWDLAQQHPVTGDVRVIDDQPGAGPSMVAWTDRLGWVCWGERSGTGASAIFGAFACAPPTNASTIALIADDNADGVLLLRVPQAVTTLQVRDAAGHPTATASLHALGGWSFAVMDRRAAGSTPGSTVTGLDRSGHVVIEVPTGSLQPLDGTVWSYGA